MSKVKAKKTVAVKDKWRTKTWFEIYSPTYLNSVEIASTPAFEESGVRGRVIETTLYDLTDDFTKSHITLYFQVNDIKGTKAYTIFKGHQLTRDYLRSLIRRGTSRIDSILDVTTNDNYKMRLTAVVFTETRGKTSQQHTIRQLMTETIIKYAKENPFEKFVVDIVSENLAKQIHDNVRVIMPVRRVEVLKSRLKAVPAN